MTYNNKIVTLIQEEMDRLQNTTLTTRDQNDELLEAVGPVRKHPVHLPGIDRILIFHLAPARQHAAKIL